VDAARDRRDPVTRPVRLTLVVMAFCVVAISALPAVATAGAKPGNPNPRPLWSAFPLDPQRQTGRPAARTGGSAKAEPRRGPSAAKQARGDGSSWWLVLTGTLVVVAAAAAVAAYPRLRRVARRRRRRRASSTIAIPYAFHSPEGGLNMVNRPRKFWERAASDEQPEDEPANEGGDVKNPLERLAAYSAKEQKQAAVEPVQSDGESRGVEAVADGGAEAPDGAESGVEAVSDGGAEASDGAKSGVEALSAVGDEVGSILNAARDAAAKMSRAAEEDAATKRAEATAAADAELAEARRAAEAERAEAARIRAEADAYAADTRAAADAFAHESRAAAEREAAATTEKARTRLESADAAVEEKMRQAEAKTRERLETLKADAERYEERLQRIFEVFRGMSSELEALIAARGIVEAQADAEPSDAELEAALRPEPVNSRVA
jgi:hypothetical protein